MKIVFMGTPHYATVILDRILQEKIEVIALFTQPDRAVGRKQTLTPPDVKKYILEKELDIEIYQPTTLRGEKIYRNLTNLNPDFIVVAAYGQILPKEILDICPCINLHASILPKYRGASPIQSAILNGDKIGGVTAMKMDVGLDDGDMLAFSFDDIEGLNSSELFVKFSQMAASLIIEVLKNYDKIAPLKQLDALSSKCPKIKKEDGLVKFSDDVDEVMAKFRAFYPWPGVFLENNTKLLQIAKAASKSSSGYGKITKISKESFSVGFSSGDIEIFKLQESGKKPLLARDFINGKRLKEGDRFDENILSK